MQIFVKCADGQTAVLDVDASMSVQAVKEQFVCKDQLLVCGGIPLEDDQQVGSIGVDGLTIHVAPRLCGGGDGTPALGKRHKKTHGLCIRCGKRSFHYQKKTCASCGYPRPKMRRYMWAHKAARRRARGSGRMSYLKHMPRRAKNNFREGTVPKPRKVNKT